MSTNILAETRLAADMLRTMVATMRRKSERARLGVPAGVWVEVTVRAKVRVMADNSSMFVDAITMVAEPTSEPKERT